MYHGKRIKTTKKTVILLVSLVLVIGVAVGGTIAFLIDQTEDVKNTFTPSSMNPVIEEEIRGDVKEKVTIKNEGDVPAYVRATVVVNWLDPQGNVYGGKVPEEGKDYSMNLPANENWVPGADGYYYYKLPVPGGESTAALLTNGMALNEEMLGKDYQLSMEILAQTIQAVPETVVSEVWSSGVSGVSTVNGVKTLTVIPPSGGTT